MGNKQCVGDQHVARSHLCQEGCDNSVCAGCYSMSVNGKKSCLECKIRVTHRRQSEFVKSKKEGMSGEEMGEKIG
jgi:hypothetical protein